jgi:predicted MPP superfamily phosphohydrolase
LAGFLLASHLPRSGGGLRDWKKFIKRILLSLLGLTLALLVWGVAVEPRLIDVEEEEFALPHLPPAWEGRRVALIADLQVGMWLGNVDTIRRIAARLIKERPALVLIAGDFIYRPVDEETQPEAREEQEPEEVRETLRMIDHAVALVAPLTEAGIPTYAVLGNHDYAMGRPDDVKLEWVARRVRQSLEAAGVRVLENQAARAPAPGVGDQPLYIVGVGSHFAKNDHPEAALAQVPPEAPRIVFMHNPESFAAAPAGAAPLALAGHTHGGQVRIPFTPEWTWLNYFKEEKAHADGWIHGFGQPGNRLYVNRGIGFSYVPVRINCPPEITMITLRRAVWE